MHSRHMLGATSKTLGRKHLLLRADDVYAFFGLVDLALE